VGFHGRIPAVVSHQLFKGWAAREYIASLLAGYNREEKEEAGPSYTKQPSVVLDAWQPPLWAMDVEVCWTVPRTISESVAQDVRLPDVDAEPKLNHAQQTGCP